ncbi:hypothetical protein B566_EDAN008959 [Ephemera danica]|nr:hypothetical protein B566_EDAN008959 [Ephemera danica]
MTDAWTDTGRLSADDQQDCNNFRHVSHGHVTKFFFSRDFDTCDPNDYVIEDGTTHVVWGVGQGPLYRISGLNISSATYSGMQRTQLLKAEFPPSSQPEDTVPLEFTADRVRVPNVETTYWCHVHLLPDELRANKHHVIQFGPAIQKGNEPLVHHMELFHCELPVSQEVPLYQGPCRDPGRPPTIDACKRVFSAWAMGASPFDYPEEAGLPIGGPDYNPYVMLEGLRKEGIVIFGSQLHTHLTGIRVETRHIRDGRELSLLNQDNHYSTHFQEIRRLRRPVTVLPGDALVTSCYYDTISRDNVTLGGFSISDEMCVNYVHYYPKSRLEVCKSAVSEHGLATYFRFLNE